jgi:hypothetical protein
VKISSLEEKMSICDVLEGQGFEAGDQIKMAD